MNKLILGNKNYSSWSMRAWLALKKAGIEFEEIVIALSQDDTKHRLSAYSPAGKVPVFICADTKIWDSLAICEYAAELNPTLWPQAQQTRALARSISSEMHSGFSTIRQSMPMNCRASNRRIKFTDNITNEIQRIETIWTDCRDANQTSNPWLFGQFSIADAMFAPVVCRFHTYGVSLNSQCSQYMHTVLTDKDVSQWFEAAAQESEVIEDEEVGR